MAKGNTITVTATKSGLELSGVIPYSDFSAEKQGKEYTITRNGESITQTPTPRRDFSKSVTPVDVVWPDGKIRTLKLAIKANNPLTPDEYVARTEKAAESRLLSGVSSLKGLAPDVRAERIAKMRAELDAVEMASEDEADEADEK
jgi:hypothetical protein